MIHGVPALRAHPPLRTSTAEEEMSPRDHCVRRELTLQEKLRGQRMEDDDSQHHTITTHRPLATTLRLIAFTEVLNERTAHAIHTGVKPVAIQLHVLCELAHLTPQNTAAALDTIHGHLPFIHLTKHNKKRKPASQQTLTIHYPEIVEVLDILGGLRCYTHRDINVFLYEKITKR